MLSSFEIMVKKHVVYALLQFDKVVCFDVSSKRWLLWFDAMRRK